MNLHLTTDQQTRVVVVLAKPSNVPPVWGVSDRDVVDVTVSPDGLSADIVALKVGVADVSVRTNCDLGAGFCEQNHTFTVEVAPSQKVLNFYVAIPSEKPTPKPQSYWTPDDAN